MMDETPETECRQCDGQGFIRTNEWPFGPTCPACNGMGYRPMTEDEEADAAEEQHRLMCEGEPPLSMQEAYEIAFRQKQRSEEHTSELQSLMRISYAVFCLKKKKKLTNMNVLQRKHEITQ